MGATVEGAVFEVTSVEAAGKLARYQTKVYRTVPCTIEFTDGKEPETTRGRTFRFAGDPHDLSEGRSDLKEWLRLMGRGNTMDELDTRKVEEK